MNRMLAFTCLLLSACPAVAKAPHDIEVDFGPRGVPIVPGSAFSMVCTVSTVVDTLLDAEVELFLTDGVLTAGGESHMSWIADLVPGAPVVLNGAIVFPTEGAFLLRVEVKAVIDGEQRLGHGRSIVCASTYPMLSGVDPDSSVIATIPAEVAWFPDQLDVEPASEFLPLGDDSLLNVPPGVPDEAIAASGSVVVTGQVVYRHPFDGTLRPIVNALIEIWDDDFDSLPVCGPDDHLGNTSTDAEGRFTKTVSDGDCSGGADIFVKVKLQNSATIVLYYLAPTVTFRGPNHSDVHGPAHNYGRMEISSTVDRLYCLMFEDMNRIVTNYRRIIPNSAYRPLACPIMINVGGDRSSYRWDETGYFFSDRGRIYLAADDIGVIDTQAHEWGHHLSQWLDASDRCGCGTTLVCIGSDHTYHEAQSETCGWSEGFSDFLAPVIDGDPDDNDYRGHLLESNSRVYEKSLADGPKTEANVASALWDLYDGVLELPQGPHYYGRDEYEGGLLNILRAMKLGNIETVQQFFLRWMASVGDGHYPVQALALNRIDLNNPPVWYAVPSVQGCRGQDLVIDFHNRVVDVETRDADMLLSVVQNTNEALQYEWISTVRLRLSLPAEGGSSTLRIRANDGLATVESSPFLVTWPVADVMAIALENDSAVADILELVGTLSECVDDVQVEWGSGPQPAIWSGEGVKSIQHSGPATSAVLATWNTGIVPSGTYRIRVTALHGSLTEVEERVVTVAHRAQAVGGSGLFSTISAAMVWAEMGDTIRVSPGTYVGNLVLKPTVQLIAAGGGLPVIEGVGNGSVITVTDHDYPATIDSFEIRRQTVTAVGATAVQIDDSRLVMRDCRFVNLVGSSGTALRATGQSLVVLENCVFEGTSNYESPYLGSVISLGAVGGAKPVIQAYDCVFESNKGVVCEIYYDPANPLQGTEPQPWFQRCIFRANEFADQIVSIHNASRTTVFRDCLFSDNAGLPRYSSSMAAVWCENANVLLDGCTIARNIKYCGPGCSDVVGGVIAQGTSLVTIEDCVVAFNDGPTVYGADGTTPSTAAMARSVAFGNAAFATARTDAGWEAAGEAIYNLDPAFCDAAVSDYRLYAFSPAAPGVYFTERAGALDVGCVPDAVVTGGPSNFPFATGDTLVVAACPAGDGPAARVLIDLDDGDVTRELVATELTLNIPDFTSKIFDADGVLPAGSDATSANGFTTTIQHGTLGFYAVDSVQVMLNGWPLEQKAGLDIRTPDAVAPFGVVNASDFSYFGESMPPNPYRAESDFNGDGAVTGSTDFAYLGAHYNHQATLPLVNAVTQVAQSSAEVVLGLTSEFLTATHQRLYVDVDLDGIGGVTTCVFSMRRADESLTFVEWQPAGSGIGRVLFAPTVRGGAPELFFGVLVAESFSEGGAHLGRMVFDVAGTTPYEVTDNDFVLTVGDVLVGTAGGPVTAAEMNGVVSRRLDSDVARIYHNRLEQNYPNPFNPATTIAFSLQAPRSVSLTVYDVAGRRVRELLNEKRNAGAYRVDWNGQNDNGQPVASGVYFYKLVAGSFTDTKKMTVLK